MDRLGRLNRISFWRARVPIALDPGRLLQSDDRYLEFFPYSVGFRYAAIGDKERAFEWLEKAYKAHDDSLPYLKVDPDLRKTLGSDPHYADLLRRMGLPQ